MAFYTKVAIFGQHRLIIYFLKLKAISRRSCIVLSSNLYRMVRYGHKNLIINLFWVPRNSDEVTLKRRCIKTFAILDRAIVIYCRSP